MRRIRPRSLHPATSVRRCGNHASDLDPAGSQLAEIRETGTTPSGAGSTPARSWRSPGALWFQAAGERQGRSDFWTGQRRHRARVGFLGRLALMIIPPTRSWRSPGALWFQAAGERQGRSDFWTGQRRHRGHVGFVLGRPTPAIASGPRLERQRGARRSRVRCDLAASQLWGGCPRILIPSMQPYLKRRQSRSWRFRFWPHRDAVLCFQGRQHLPYLGSVRRAYRRGRPVGRGHPRYSASGGLARRPACSPPERRFGGYRENVIRQAMRRQAGKPTGRRAIGGLEKPG